MLEDVTMEVDLADMEDFELCPELTVPLKRMPHQSAGSTFTVLQVCLPYCALATVILGVTCLALRTRLRRLALSRR